MSIALPTGRVICSFSGTRVPPDHRRSGGSAWCGNCTRTVRIKIDAGAPRYVEHWRKR